jgi:HAMP domain-containing protein
MNAAKKSLRIWNPYDRLHTALRIIPHAAPLLPSVLPSSKQSMLIPHHSPLFNSEKMSEAAIISAQDEINELKAEINDLQQQINSYFIRLDQSIDDKEKDFLRQQINHDKQQINHDKQQITILLRASVATRKLIILFSIS